MSQPRPTQDPDLRRGLGLWLAVAACLVIAAALAVWLLSVRDPGSPTEAAAATTTTSTTTAATSAAVGAAEAPAAGALTTGSLMTPEDVATAGPAVADPVEIVAPVFPVLCDAADWRTQWSAPVQGLGQEYPAQGAVLSEYAFGYADPDSASAALARVVEDAGACPDPSTGGSVESAGPATAGGDESAVLVTDDGGRDGVIGVTWSVVVRSDETLLLVTYRTEQQIGTGSGPVDGGDDSSGDSAGARATAEALARAALDRFTGAS